MDFNWCMNCVCSVQNIAHDDAAKSHLFRFECQSYQLNQIESNRHELLNKGERERNIEEIWALISAIVLLFSATHSIWNYFEKQMCIAHVHVTLISNPILASYLFSYHINNQWQQPIKDSECSL